LRDQSESKAPGRTSSDPDDSQMQYFRMVVKKKRMTDAIARQDDGSVMRSINLDAADDQYRWRCLTS
jgi:hypothetical protein